MDKNTLMLLVGVCVVWLGTGELVCAGPEITVVIPDKLDIGRIPYPGDHTLGCPFTIHVVSPDIGYSVDFSFSEFTNQDGGIIPLSRTIIDAPQINRVPTSLLGEDQDINLTFNMTTTFTDLAGTYTGNLTITVMPW